jgi:BON domain
LPSIPRVADESRREDQSPVREDVIGELRWDPQVLEPDAIGVAVSNGAVTLTGHTSTYAEKLAAARAAGRVYRVNAVASELEVRLAADRAETGFRIALDYISALGQLEGLAAERSYCGWAT